MMDFAYEMSQLTATLSNGGGGSLQINSPTLHLDSGSGWLSAYLSGSVLYAQVNRDGLAPGAYSGRIQLTSNGGNETVEVRMNVGQPTPVDPGTVYILLLNPRNYTVIDGTVTDSSVGYRYTLPQVPVGDYIVAAGTDLDGDNLVCEAGDFCGIYPVLSQPSLVTVEIDSLTGPINIGLQKLDPVTSQGAESGLGLPAIPFGGDGIPITTQSFDMLKIGLQGVSPEPEQGFKSGTTAMFPQLMSSELPEKEQTH